MWETWVWSLDWEDPLQKGKATYSSILDWRIPRLYSPWGLKELDMTERLSLSLFSAFLELIFWMTGGWKGARWQVTEVSFWYSPLNQLKSWSTSQILKLWDVNMLCCLCRCTKQRVPLGHILKDKIQVSMVFLVPCYSQARPFRQKLWVWRDLSLSGVTQTLSQGGSGGESPSSSGAGMGTPQPMNHVQPASGFK